MGIFMVQIPDCHPPNLFLKVFREPDGVRKMSISEIYQLLPFIFNRIKTYRIISVHVEETTSDLSVLCFM